MPVLHLQVNPGNRDCRSVEAGPGRSVIAAINCRGALVGQVVAMTIIALYSGIRSSQQIVHLARSLQGEIRRGLR